jgi:hypothetical protein
MRTPQDEDAIHKEIVDQLIIATPEWWDYAILTVSQSPQDDVDTCEHSISNPKHPADCVEATEQLMSATRSLALFYKRRRTPWSRATYEVWQREDGQWAFKAEFTYE